MKKTIVIIAAMIGVFGLTSCEDLTWSQVQQQVGSALTDETVVSLAVTKVIEEHPDSIGTWQKIADEITKLSAYDTLTVADVMNAVKQRISESQLLFKAEMTKAVEKIFTKVGLEKGIGIAEHRTKLLQVVSGIEWAIKYYEQAHGVVSGK